VIINCIVCAINVSVPAGRNAIKKLCYELSSDFSKQLKVIVIVIGKMKCNCNLIVIDKNVIDPCLILLP